MAAPADVPSLDTLVAGGKAALARALAILERDPDNPAVIALLDAAYAAPKGDVVGLTGPPGVGKSTLLARLIEHDRGQGRRVGVIAVDPSSRRSGGALLGDRMRLAAKADDEGVFIRSMAARDRLGGLAALTVAAMVLMRAVFDRVIIETVGVGQSETDIEGIADTVVFCVQPASGDSLQFMKAGIVEVPHIAVVTKADMTTAATRALADLRGALSLATSERGAGAWSVVCLAVSAAAGEGMEAFFATLDRRAAWLDADGRREAQRHRQACGWLRDAVQDRFGRHGLARLSQQGASLTLAPGTSPFARLRELDALLSS